jgi:hypothetical protein
MATAPTFPSGAAAQEAMTTLTAQWYNAVVTGCGLDPNTFQLAQGIQPLPNLSEGLWEIFDAVPPMSVSNYWNPAEITNFSQTYQGVVANLIPQSQAEFQTQMGDYYPQWVSYLHSSPPPTIPAVTGPPSAGMVALFQSWQELNMPPGLGQTCLTLYQAVALGVVPVAMSMLYQNFGKAFAYNKTIEDLTNAMTASTPGKSVYMNSATTSSDVSKTWANGKVIGEYDFFEGEGSADYDSLSTQIAEAGVEINATFNHVLTFTAGPLSAPSQDPILSSYVPWYDSEALNLAYANNNNFVWGTGAPTWAETFGPDGNLQNLLTSIVVVSGVTITTTSSASFDASQQTTVKASLEVGFFPFFGAEASGGWSHVIKQMDSAGLVIDSTVPEGVFVILGAIVTPIASVTQNG